MPGERTAGTAAQREAGAATQDAERALRERVKELSCLYGISLEAFRDGVPLDVRLRSIVAHLPPAWQFEDLAGARIVLDDLEYRTERWCESGQRQSAAVVIGGRTRGRVDISYQPVPEGEPQAGFLREERDLIDAVARKVALLLERVEAERERERLRGQLLHADRLATVGRLAAGLGHELNEPLGSILGFAQLVARDPALPDRVSQDIDRIVKAALHAREIVRRLMLFVRPARPRRKSIDLPRLMLEVADVFHARATRQGVDIDVVSADTGAELVADPEQLNQVLVNLVVNALHAMPEGGTLTLSVSEEEEAVILVARDTGVGMSESVVTQIFEPFFTTRDVGEGTGLGLSVVHGIVQAHGGRIAVESVRGEGSTFTVTLPRRAAGENEPRT